MRIVLLGKGGQVGEALHAELCQQGDVIAWGREQARLEEPASLADRVAEQRPDVIVNAAAYTAVDRAESEPDVAFLVNATAAAALAGAAKRQGAWLVHFSTDYVFDGLKADPYAEDDDASPLGVYGRSKLAGDDAVRAADCLHLIFRLSWVYAANHANFPQRILDLARQRNSLDVIADQVGAPTSARLIAAVTAKAIAVAVDAQAPRVFSGIYNLTPAGAVSRADLARFIIREAAARGADLTLRPDAVRSVTAEAFPSPAARPLNSRLDTSKLRRTFAVDLPPWQADMRDWVAHELAEVRP